MSNNKLKPLRTLMVSAPTHINGPIAFITDLLESGLQKPGYEVTSLPCWDHRRPKEELWVKIVQGL